MRDQKLPTEGCTPCGGDHDATVGDNASGLTAATEPSNRLLVPALAAVVVVGVLGPIKVVHATDVAVEGENFAKPPGTTVVSDTLFSEGQALKFTADVTASHTDSVTCSTPCDVVLMARAGQSGGRPSFSVNDSAPQAITTSNQVAPEPYRNSDVMRRPKSVQKSLHGGL